MQGCLEGPPLRGDGVCACFCLSSVCVMSGCPSTLFSCNRHDDNIIVGIKKRLPQFKYNLSFIFEVYSNLRFAFPPLLSKLPASPASCYMGRQLPGTGFFLPWQCWLACSSLRSSLRADARLHHLGPMPDHS